MMKIDILQAAMVTGMKKKKDPAITDSCSSWTTTDTTDTEDLSSMASNNVSPIPQNPNKPLTRRSLTSITRSSIKSLKKKVTRRSGSFGSSIGTNGAVNNLTIDASDDVPLEQLRNKLTALLTTKVKETTDVTVQGLVLSAFHQDKFQMVQDLASCCDDDAFRNFRFVDKLELSDYATWKARKDTMMDRSSETKVWHAQVSITKGTRLERVEDFLSSLQGDVSCGGISFVVPSSQSQTNKDSDNCESTTEQIKRLFDPKKFRLLEDIVVVVTSGWGENNDDGLKLLESSTKMMSNMLAQRGRRRRSKATAAAAAGENKPIKRSASSPTLSTTTSSSRADSSSSKTTGGSNHHDRGSVFNVNAAKSWEEFGLQNRQRLYSQRDMELSSSRAA